MHYDLLRQHTEFQELEGFAHGFVVLSDQAIVNYKCTTFYDKQANGGIRWDDPDIGLAAFCDVKRKKRT